MTTAPRPIHRPVSPLNQSLCCTASTAGWSAQEIYLARLSGLSLLSLPPSGMPRRFEAADVALRIAENRDVAVAEARQLVGQQVSLPAAQLERQRPSRAQPARALSQHTAKDVRSIRTAVVGEGRLEGEGVALQQ